jgi:hypothetical protein
MKNFFNLLAAIIITSNIVAQAPQKMNYQAVIRNVTNELLVNKPVKMRISILQGSATGNAVYSELHSTATNENGLVSIEIGGGTSPTGIFSSINWGNGTYFVKTETDPNNGTNYTITGTTQLLSVPYALISNKSDSSKYSNNAGNGIEGVLGDTLTLNNGEKYVIPGIKKVGNPPSTINNGLVAYYPFNGNANDESGNGNNGTVNGATLSTDRFGNNNKAYSFNGANNYISLNNITSFNNAKNFSVSVWAKILNLNSANDVAQYIISRGRDIIPGSFLIAFGQQTSPYTNKFATGLNGNGGVQPPSITESIPQANWHHLTTTFDGSSIKFYIDGILVGTSSYTQELSISSDITLIGKHVVPGFSYFVNGKIDDIRIYNRALTQEEITYLYNN